MPHSNSSRRNFLRLAAQSPLAVTVPYWFTGKKSLAAEFLAANDRPNVGLIGVGGRGTSISELASKFGNVVAICDVDLSHAEAAKATFGGMADVYQDN